MIYIYIYKDMISSFAMCRTEASTYWTVFSVLQQSILGDPGDVPWAVGNW
jgi:hypothetical protein